MAGDSQDTGQRLLVLGAGPAQLGLLAAAREQDLFVIAADRDAAAPGFVFADRRAIVSVEDEVGINRLAEAERIYGVISPGIDWPVAVAARVAARWGLPHPISPETAMLATLKVRQREAFAAAGVPQPRWKRVTGPDDELGFPCVVKAPDRQGQRGLSLVQEPGELPAAVERALAASRSHSCVIEELVDGPEVTVNGFSVDGSYRAVTVTDRLTAELPAFGVALAHVWPSERAGLDAAEVAARAVAALGIYEGPSYVQLRIGPDGPQVVELAARLGGGHDAELARAVTGVDLNGAALAAALGRPADLEARADRAAAGCVRFLVAPEGELLEVSGAEEAAAIEGVEWVRIYRHAGHRFGPLRTGADRAGAILAVGASRDEALKRAAAAAELIVFETVETEALV